MKSLKVAIVGCGQISTQYGEHIHRHGDRFQIVGASDLDPSRVVAFREQFGGKAYGSFEELLADPEVEVVVNLTIHHAHYEVNRKALEAGKHVFSEKPLSLTSVEALKLVDLAKEKNLRLGCAPMTFMGEAVQTAARFLQDEPLGTIRLAYAEANWGQVNTWVGSPQAFFSVGPHFDVGVYPLSVLVYLLGSAERVLGYSKIIYPQRPDSKGEIFEVTAPDFNTGVIEFCNGVVGRLTTNYYVSPRGQEHLQFVELHGDKGSLRISHCHNFDGKILFFPYGTGEPVEIPFVREPALSMDRAFGLIDLADSIEKGVSHLASAEQGAHVTEILEAMTRSSVEDRRVEVHSRFTQGGLADWAK